ncbi:hypothetical protein CBF29_13405, partial [Vagococcus elongatus]
HAPDFQHLPENLCFDEFKSVKHVTNKMSFIFCDAATRKIIDILPNRLQKTLRDYFSIYSLKARVAFMKKLFGTDYEKMKDYRKLKSYWRSMLKSATHLNYQDYSYQRLFKKPMPETEIVDYLLSLDPTLKAIY